MTDEFKTPKAPSEGLFKDKGSKFFGYIFPIKNENEVKAHLENLKSLHPKARHHCFAYKLGIDENNFRANDDGEPSGTAGKPILNTLHSFELTDALAVVVRYFGGTLLGVPGLINAYKEATKEGLGMTMGGTMAKWTTTIKEELLRRPTRMSTQTKSANGKQNLYLS